MTLTRTRLRKSTRVQRLIASFFCSRSTAGSRSLAHSTESTVEVGGPKRWLETRAMRRRNSALSQALLGALGPGTRVGEPVQDRLAIVEIDRLPGQGDLEHGWQVGERLET